MEIEFDEALQATSSDIARIVMWTNPRNAEFGIPAISTRFSRINHFLSILST
jgi:hypothetical protein